MITKQSNVSSPFGLVGTDTAKTLIPEDHPHLVLFGREVTGAINLLRYWLLWAARTNKVIVAAGIPADLYGSVPYLPPNHIKYLASNKPLREQFEALDLVNAHNESKQVLFIIGGYYELNNLEDRLFLKEMQNGAYRNDNLTDKDHVFSLIHHHSFLKTSDEPFTGSDGDAENVTLALVGDVNEATAKKVGANVPACNANGIAWLSRGGEEAKRILTYFIPREAVHPGNLTWGAADLSPAGKTSS